jgi:hypothetical protein
VKDQKEYDTVVRHGSDSRNVKFVDENTYNVITSSSTYKRPEPKSYMADKNPAQALEDFYNKWADEIPQKALDELNEIIDEAANWTVQVKEELPF